VLWADVRNGWSQRLKARPGQRPPPPVGALLDAVDEVFDSRIGDVSGRGKLGSDMREIWVMQPRFDKRVGTSPFTLVEQGRFRAGFDFLRLRAQVGEIEEELAHWWETFQNVNDDLRNDMVETQRRDNQGKPGAGKSRRVKRGDADHPDQQPAPDPRFRAVDDDGETSDRVTDDGQPDAGSGEGDADASASAPAKKRRRRRRKPGGGGGGGGADAAAPEAGTGD
jgi:poly(A) polymerase